MIPKESLEQKDVKSVYKFKVWSTLLQRKAHIYKDGYLVKSPNAFTSSKFVDFKSFVILYWR